MPLLDGCPILFVQHYWSIVMLVIAFKDIVQIILHLHLVQINGDPLLGSRKWMSGHGTGPSLTILGYPIGGHYTSHQGHHLLRIHRLPQLQILVLDAHSSYDCMQMTTFDGVEVIGGSENPRITGESDIHTGHRVTPQFRREVIVKLVPLLDSQHGGVTSSRAVTKEQL